MKQTSQSTATDRDGRTNYPARIEELRKQQTSPEPASLSRPPQVTSFFVMLALFGLVMCRLASLNGHQAAWIAGIVFLSFGGFAAGSSFCYQCILRRKSNNELPSPAVLALIEKAENSDVIPAARSITTPVAISISESSRVSA